MPAERTRASMREHFLGVPGQEERAPGGPPPGTTPHTFVVQEVQGTGHVLHHHAGLQLVEVPPLVDVAQDGAWGQAAAEGERTLSPGRLQATAQQLPLPRTGTL